MKTLETKHTPAPWTYNEADGIVESENGSPIAIPQTERAGSPLVLPEEMHANARLIAAAPRYHDLLCDAAMQLERLDGENLVAYARTFAALARQATGN